MALILLNETNTSETFAVGCSGATAGATTAGRRLGGALGSTEVTLDAGNNVQRAVLLWRTSGGLGVTTWQAGNYVVRLNLTTAQGAGHEWRQTYICERTIAGVYFTVASLTGQTTGLDSTGVKTHTVNRATDYSPLAGSSDLGIVIVVGNNQAHGNTSFGITPDRVIDTPIDDGVSGPTVIPRAVMAPYRAVA